MNKKLWKAKSKIKLNSHLYNFEKYVSKKFKQNFDQKYNKI